jgi:hypothetical protein
MPRHHSHLSFSLMKKGKVGEKYLRSRRQAAPLIFIRKGLIRNHEATRERMPTIAMMMQARTILRLRGIIRTAGCATVEVAMNSFPPEKTELPG